MIYTYVPNFISIGLFSHLLVAKIPNFCVFLDFGILWCHQLAAIWESWTWCTTKNLPLSISIKIISVLQRLVGEIMCTISDVHKHDEQTKNSKFLAAPAAGRVKSEPHQTWLGDRGPRAHSCSSKTFGVRRSFAARGTENLGGTRPLNLKPPNSVTLWANPSKFYQLMHSETRSKFCKFRENCTRDMPLRGIYIPNFGKISVKISVFGVEVLCHYCDTDWGWNLAWRSGP